MFDIKKILKRSWQILWNYKMLWAFGFILALGGLNIGSNSNYRLNDSQRNQPAGIQSPDGWDNLQGDTFAEKMNNAFQQMGAGIQKLQEQYPVEFRLGTAAVITFFVMAILVGILISILWYVAQTASIRMVDEYEQSGVKVGFRQAWKYGWSRAAWRLFLVNFVAHIPVIILFVTLGLIVWWAFSALMGGVIPVISIVISGSGLAFLFIFLTIVVLVAAFILRDFAWRIVVIEGMGSWEALRTAFQLVKRQWKNVGLMWLVMIGVRIAWGIAFLILIFPLMIISIFTALGGLVVAVAPTLLTAGIASLLAAPDYWPWIFAAIIGLPLFFVVTFSPILLVGGWGEIYQANVWTLAYRELKTLEAVTPVVDPSQPISS